MLDLLDNVETSIKVIYYTDNVPPDIFTVVRVILIDCLNLVYVQTYIQSHWGANVSSAGVLISH
jgi:hypothetical protein